MVKKNFDRRTFLFSKPGTTLSELRTPKSGFAPNYFYMHHKKQNDPHTIAEKRKKNLAWHISPNSNKLEKTEKNPKNPVFLDVTWHMVQFDHPKPPGDLDNTSLHTTAGPMGVLSTNST